MTRALLLLLVPVAPVLEYFPHAPSLWVFIAGIVAIAVLAEWIRFPPSNLPYMSGPAIGSLLTVSLWAAWRNCSGVVRPGRGRDGSRAARSQPARSSAPACWASVSAIVVGGVNPDRQQFRRERAGLLSSLLILSVIALLLPALFDYTARFVTRVPGRGASDEELQPGSFGGSVAALRGEPAVHTGHPPRRVRQRRGRGGRGALAGRGSLLALAGCTAAAALESELVAGALTDAVAGARDHPELFLGVIVLALVGTIADIFRCGLVCAPGPDGARDENLQSARASRSPFVVAPLLVILSWFIGHPMTWSSATRSSSSPSRARR